MALEKCNIRPGTVWETEKGTRVVVVGFARLSEERCWMVVYAGLSLEGRKMFPNACRTEESFREKFKANGDFRLRNGAIVMDDLFVEELFEDGA